MACNLAQAALFPCALISRICPLLKRQCRAWLDLRKVFDGPSSGGCTLSDAGEAGLAVILIDYDIKPGRDSMMLNATDAIASESVARQSNSYKIHAD